MAETPAHTLPYGPGTPRIRRFLQKLAGIGAAAEYDVVKAHRRYTQLDEYRAAELAIGVAVARAGREREQAALAGPLLQLVLERGDDATDPHVRPVAEPALAALLALMMEDLLSAAEFGSLYAAFADAIPRDALG